MSSTGVFGGGVREEDLDNAPQEVFPTKLCTPLLLREGQLRHQTLKTKCNFLEIFRQLGPDPNQSSCLMIWGGDSTIN